MILVLWCLVGWSWYDGYGTMEIGCLVIALGGNVFGDGTVVVGW